MIKTTSHHDCALPRVMAKKATLLSSFSVPLGSRLHRNESECAHCSSAGKYDPAGSHIWNVGKFSSQTKPTTNMTTKKDDQDRIERDIQSHLCQSSMDRSKSRVSCTVVTRKIFKNSWSVIKTSTYHIWLRDLESRPKARPSVALCSQNTTSQTSLNYVVVHRLTTSLPDRVRPNRQT